MKKLLTLILVLSLSLTLNSCFWDNPTPPATSSSDITTNTGTTAKIDFNLSNYDVFIASNGFNLLTNKSDHLIYSSNQQKKEIALVKGLEKYVNEPDDWASEGKDEGVQYKFESYKSQTEEDKYLIVFIRKGPGSQRQDIDAWTWYSDTNLLTKVDNYIGKTYEYSPDGYYGCLIYDSKNEQIIVWSCDENNNSYLPISTEKLIGEGKFTYLVEIPEKDKYIKGDLPLPKIPVKVNSIKNGKLEYEMNGKVANVEIK